MGIAAKVLTFDCYGTLVDWESGILAALQPWLLCHQVMVTNDALLEVYAELEPAVESATPRLAYRDVLREVHNRLAARFGIEPDEAEAERFADSVRDWPVFPDTPPALRRLADGHRLMIVSNVDQRSFEGSARLLGVAFDAVVTAESVGAYKPDLRMFERAQQVASEWGLGRDDMLHVAQSLYHDHVPAARIGLRSVWINRRAGRAGSGATAPPDGEVCPVAEFPDMATFAEWMCG